MAEPKDKEEFLQRQVDELEKQQLELAEKMEQIAGIDCTFSVCLFDKNIDSVELKLEDVQRRKKAIESMMMSLKESEAE
jgi:hypothetical protein